MRHDLKRCQYHLYLPRTYREILDPRQPSWKPSPEVLAVLGGPRQFWLVLGVGFAPERKKSCADGLLFLSRILPLWLGCPLKTLTGLSKFHCLIEESWEGLSCSLGAPALASTSASFSLGGVLWNHRKELSWPGCRDVPGGGGWRQPLISTVMRLIKSPAGWSG